MGNGWARGRKRVRKSVRCRFIAPTAPRRAGSGRFARWFWALCIAWGLRAARRTDLVVAYGSERTMRAVLEYYGPLPSPTFVASREERDVEVLKSLLRQRVPKGAIWVLLYKEETPRGRREPAIVEAIGALGLSYERLPSIGKTTIYRCSQSPL